MDEDFSNNMILVDLQKDAHTLNHVVFLLNMECIGFKESVIKCSESYLPNRKCFVALEHIFSDGGLLNCGAPYGSSLGPFVFVIYVNDLPYALKETERYLYNDDVIF